jgi:NADH-quinone oxidoreductase subunit E
MSNADLLSDHVKDEIEHWKSRFPEGRERSAVISALHAVQHENNGYLTAELMNAVAEYLDLPTIHVYEVATFYSMFQTKPVGRHNVAI